MFYTSTHHKSADKRAEEFLKQDLFLRSAFKIIDKMVHLSPDRPSVLVDEVLHSIFFLGIIHSPPYLPQAIVSNNEMLKELQKWYPQPFNFYSTQLPKRSPFSCVLDMIIYLTGKKGLLTEEAKESDIIESLREVISDLKKDEAIDLISSAICVSQKKPIQDSVRYYGVSMSTSGRVPGQIMVAASCLGTWDPYVADAVMTYYPGKVKKNYFDGTFQIQELIRCQAFSLTKGDQMDPCRSCGNLFGLTTCQKNVWAYGNCAEAESISNLLKNENEVRGQIRPASDRNMDENNWQRAIESVVNDLKKWLKSVRFNQHLQFYTPPI
nr:uncharacterized protein LOC109990879 isoform X1 [Labrus bergylta]